MWRKRGIRARKANVDAKEIIKPDESVPVTVDPLEPATGWLGANENDGLVPRMRGTDGIRGNKILEPVDRTMSKMINDNENLDELQSERYQRQPQRKYRNSKLKDTPSSLYPTAMSAETPVSRKKQQTNNGTVNLPILLIPGIASSGLYIENSGIDNNRYKGKRLWMNPAFLASSALDRSFVASYGNYSDDSTTISSDSQITCNGRSRRRNSSIIKRNDSLPEDSEHSFCEDSFHESSACNDLDQGSLHLSQNSELSEQENDIQIRSAWLYHMSLAKNMVDERPGNRVRTYEGLKACEWLAGKTLGGAVFADLIRFLQDEMGYIRGKNIDAAPYDWRLPPRHTEARDSYLTGTIQKVERMYEENGDLPVVLCCHSMGCKMGHYFLNFCLERKGRAWIDKHIYAYMPVGAPHAGASSLVKLGATGAGLVAFMDNLMLSLDEGLIMYRSWGSGPWLMPRDIPSGRFPPCIVRREGELGIKIISEIDVGPIFANKRKPPRELRLTIIFRGKTRVSTDFAPLEVKSESSIMVSFNETFYLAIPYQDEHKDDLGQLVFYLEEPSGWLYRGHNSLMRRKFQNATTWARGFKKEMTRTYRNLAKKVSSGLRVAVCRAPLKLKVTDFLEGLVTKNGLFVLAQEVQMCKCKGSNDAKKQITRLGNSEREVYDEVLNLPIDSSHHSTMSFYSGGSDHGSLPSFATIDSNQPSFNFVVKATYSPPRDLSKEPSNINAKFAVIPGDEPAPPIVHNQEKSRKAKKIIYDTWSGKDLLERDGFCDDIFNLYREYYEEDHLGPTTRSALDAPPVRRVRSIYGINDLTEVSVVYRKRSVVTIGDNIADSRYIIDKSATFDQTRLNGDVVKIGTGSVTMDTSMSVAGYNIRDGIISETPRTMQTIPGKNMGQQRQCCGDGTVPYWSLSHCLSWQDSIPDLTVNELEGAGHRPILSDRRFLSLVKKYCCGVDDPRAVGAKRSSDPTRSPASMTSYVTSTSLPIKASSSFTQRRVSKASEVPIAYVESTITSASIAPTIPTVYVKATPTPIPGSTPIPYATSSNVTQIPSLKASRAYLPTATAYASSTSQIPSSSAQPPALTASEAPIAYINPTSVPIPASTAVPASSASHTPALPIAYITASPLPTRRLSTLSISPTSPTSPSGFKVKQESGKMLVPGIGLRPIGDFSLLKPASISSMPYKGAPKSNHARIAAAPPLVSTITQGSGEVVTPGIGLRPIDDRRELKRYV
mmetsp:Transcript_338/g.814  ORF Transcript_338/g.814 Transcript_338/m.814 type:complete len:1230 (+) Transcript_338:69-3758(+)|eukprot:CAMPEP_0197199416 /NCGR_PEP_ID=MMETSP1423-20130617/33873_1 /TAXON_ID=476441 /ORGANISM="Pseudo-nitzschia heimii, Strain UNC1101" /LENGTH=1229 /DNA_ID=CAMNT_0042653273 /DNA_START=9 /DNA_END=3698 /DNA_ORIENTATION=+